MSRLLALTLLATSGCAVAAGLYHWSEARRVGARTAHLERHALGLEAKLAAALQERDAVNAFLARKAGEMRERAERERHDELGIRPIPEGVRLALAAANELFADGGFPGVRFLRASALDDRELRDVELLERGDDLTTVLYLADRATMSLDRSTALLTLRLMDGRRVCGGDVSDLPPEGLPLVFEDVDAPAWEGRLGHVLETTGAYPAPEQAGPGAAGLDRYSRSVWLARLEQLLGAAQTQPRYRVQEIDGLRDGAFTGVVLLGYESGKILDMAIEADSMSVVTDAAHATVELVLRGGVMRKSGGESRIDERGYRILLPGVTVAQATEAMMGMVIAQ